MLLKEQEKGRGFQLSTLPKDTSSYAAALPRFLASEDWHAEATNVDAQRIGELLERIFSIFPAELGKPNPFKLRLRITFPKQLKRAYFNNTVEMSLWEGWARNLAAGLQNIPEWSRPESLTLDNLAALHRREFPANALESRPDLIYFASTPFRNPGFERMKEEKTRQQRRKTGRKYYFPNYAVHTPEAVVRMHAWLEEDAAIFSRINPDQPNIAGLDVKMLEALRLTLASTAKQGGGLYVCQEGEAD
jgi:hypothetical protein